LNLPALPSSSVIFPGDIFSLEEGGKKKKKNGEKEREEKKAEARS
jgi:hypothetical protein